MIPSEFRCDKRNSGANIVVILKEKNTIGNFSFSAYEVYSNKNQVKHTIVFLSMLLLVWNGYSQEGKLIVNDAVEQKQKTAEHENGVCVLCACKSDSRTKSAILWLEK